MSNPTHIIVGKLNPEWCYKQAEHIISSIPVSETSNASGKFFHNYNCWHFYKDTNIKLIQEVVSVIDNNSFYFEDVFKRKPVTNFAVLSVVNNASEEMCLWHQDGYFFNGQYHLTIEGNGNILVETENGVEEINVEPGTIWYLNGSEYTHKIKPTSGRRIELCFPMNQIEEHVQIKKSCIDLNNPTMNLLGDHPTWVELRKQQKKYVVDAIKKGSASNSNVAGFGTDG